MQATCEHVVTTLERYPARLQEVLSRDGVELPVVASVAQALTDAEEAGDEPRAQQIRAKIIEAQMTNLVLMLEQGFILLAKDRPAEAPAPWVDPGVRLDVLDATRYGLAFETEYPMGGDPDPARVNSILRPTFPTLPWWDPRLPY